VPLDTLFPISTHDWGRFLALPWFIDFILPLGQAGGNPQVREYLKDDSPAALEVGHTWNASLESTETFMGSGLTSWVPPEGNELGEVVCIDDLFFVSQLFTLPTSLNRVSYIADSPFGKCSQAAQEADFINAEMPHAAWSTGRMARWNPRVLELSWETIRAVFAYPPGQSDEGMPHVSNSRRPCSGPTEMKARSLTVPRHSLVIVHLCSHPQRRL
jgi:hypothetical protein